MEEYASEIADFEEHVSNGSLDGYGNFFVFNGKHIISWNIELNDEEEVRKKNPEYYHEYRHVMQRPDLAAVFLSGNNKRGLPGETDLSKEKETINKKFSNYHL